MINRKIIFFAKSPQIGKVKTRLAASIGMNKTFAVYNLLLKYNWMIIHQTQYPVTIEYTPSGTLEMMNAIFPQANEFSLQKGENIGVRMAHAFQKIFASGADQAVLLGSDLADLTGDIITTAFKKLETNDIVLGPSNDGGYYLIGFNKKSFRNEIFQTIDWSSDQVFIQTQNKISDSKRSLYILPERNDIDTIDDIKLFLSENKEENEFRNALNSIVFGERS